MKKLNLKKSEMRELEKLHKDTNYKRFADRIKVILALANGYTYDQIKRILLIDERTSRRYKKLYREGGIDLLFSNNFQGRQPKLSPEQEKELSEHIEKNLYKTAKEIVEYIKLKYGKTFTPEGLVITLHRLGFSHKKTKPVPAKADREKQEAFVEEYENLKENLKSNEKIFFLDAVHPSHNTMPAYAWIKKGTDKEIKSNTGRQRLNLNGVYSPLDQEIIVREDITINGESTINLFKMIELKHPELEKIFIIADNAKYYHCKLVKDYLKTSKVELISLPPYSPNLNLIERLWKFFKKKILYNEYYSKFADFKKASLDFFENKVHDLKDELTSLMRENFRIRHAE